MRLLLATASLALTALGSGTWVVHDAADRDGTAAASLAAAFDRAASDSRFDEQRDLPRAVAPGRAERLSTKRRGGGSRGCGGARCKPRDATDGEQASSDDAESGHSGPSYGATCGFSRCGRAFTRVGGANGRPPPRPPPGSRPAAAANAPPAAVLLMTDETACIGGFAIDAGTGDGLPGLEVRLEPLGAAPQLALTDETGAFEFTGLGAGSYSLSCAGLEGAMTAGAAAVAPLELSAGQLVTDLVLDVSGEPSPRSAR